MQNTDIYQMTQDEREEYEATHTTMAQLRATAIEQLASLGESPEQLETWSREDWERYAATFDQIISDAE